MHFKRVSLKAPAHNIVAGAFFVRVVVDKMNHKKENGDQERIRLQNAETLEHYAQFLALLREYAETSSNTDSLMTGTIGRDLSGALERYQLPVGGVVLALVGDQVVACGALSPVTDHPGDGELKRMYVRPSHRGKGLGRRIAARLIERAYELGYQRVVLSTYVSSLDARNLYQSLGFRAIAPFKKTPLQDLMFMGMALGEKRLEIGDWSDESQVTSHEPQVSNGQSPVVFKVSGSDLDDPAFSQRLAELIAAQAKAGARPILVHGGGKEITELLGALKIESRFIEGLRVTDGPTRDVALMVLSGLANKRLVAHLLTAGANAIGLSGVDGALVRVERINAELQYVGKPTQVNAALLHHLLDQGMVPVINPMSIDDHNEICNVNADHVAGAIAAALDASMLTFITNVPGVLDPQKSLIPSLQSQQTQALIADGTISGGMIPKVRTCLEALGAGVKQVRITNLDGVADNAGTVFGI